MLSISATIQYLRSNKYSKAEQSKVYISYKREEIKRVFPIYKASNRSSFPDSERRPRKTRPESVPESESESESGFECASTWVSGVGPLSRGGAGLSFVFGTMDRSGLMTLRRRSFLDTLELIGYHSSDKDFRVGLTPSKWFSMCCNRPRLSISTRLQNPHQNFPVPGPRWLDVVRSSMMYFIPNLWTFLRCISISDAERVTRAQISHGDMFRGHRQTSGYLCVFS